MKIFSLKSIQSSEPKYKKGFTLVEMLIAISLFALVTSFSIGAVLSIFDANRKARTSKTVVDNLNLSLENMARIIRFGDNYYCGESFNTENKRDGSDCNALSVTFDSRRIIYKWGGDENSPIERSDDGGINYSSITSPDTKIQQLKFYVYGTNSSPDTTQPYIVAVIKGYVGERPTSQSSFSIETLISQRILDIQP